MVDYQFHEFNFDKFSALNREQTIFVVARAKQDNRVTYFLINENSGNVYSRTENDEYWKEIGGQEREIIFAHLDTFMAEGR